MSQIPPLMTKREAPPQWGPKIQVGGGDNRLPIVEEREATGVVGHIKATIGLLLGWLWFLIIINAIGVCLHYIDEDIRKDTTLLGSSFWWWCLFVDVVVVGWYILKMIVSIFFVILKKIKILSFAYYLIAPFKNNVNGIVWVVMITAVHDFILDGSVPRLQTLNQNAADRIVKVLAALLVVFVIMLVKRAIVLVIEVALYRKMEEEILEAEVQNAAFGRLFKSGPKGLDKALGAGGNLDDMVVPPGLLGWIKLVTIADDMRAEGMHAINNRFPYGTDILVPEEILRSESKIVGKELFDNLTGGSGSLTEDRCIETFGKAAGMTVWDFLTIDEASEADAAHVAAGCEDAFMRRAAFQRLLTGRQLLVSVSNDLLTVLAVFISALVILDAFDIDTGSIMGPNILVVACLTFIFAPFLRDFVASMYMIFFVRPFDLGDYITVDAGQFPGEELLVKETKVMMTHFRNEAGEMVYLSNAVIANSKVHNLSRLRSKPSKFVRNALKHE